MNTLSKILHERAVNKALIDAVSSDDFRVSRAVGVLDPEQARHALRDIAHTLGETGYIGTVYVEQDDQGNGVQDIAPTRINIEFRNGQPVDAPQAKKIGHSTLGLLHRFPADLR